MSGIIQYNIEDVAEKCNIKVFKSMSFDVKGYLEEISCNVKSNRNGTSGSFGMGFLNTTNKDKKIGFFYDYSKNAKVDFCTGACDL